MMTTTEEIRDALAAAIYAEGDAPEWLTTEDGSPNAAAYEIADRVIKAELFPEATETEQWAVEVTEDHEYEQDILTIFPATEEHARTAAENYQNRVPVRRTLTTFKKRASAWERR